MPAVAKSPDNNALEDLGRATLRIVHDLKNQLNGIKLYATFLRKRAESENRSPEEREVLAKLIAGLDHAARDMTLLVKYSRPIELHRRRANLRAIIAEAGSSKDFTSEDAPLHGEFDPEALSEAFRLITEHVTGRRQPRDQTQITIEVQQSDPAGSREAMIEWHGANLEGRSHPVTPIQNYSSVHAALAAKIIEAHGGRVEFKVSCIRAWLPLSD